jgi:di/tricarboxylate transporter
MKGEGAIVFLIAFFAALIATLAAPGIPPGPQLYGLLGVPVTDYPVLGIPATTLAIAIINGVVFGVIAWLIFTFGMRIYRRT